MSLSLNLGGTGLSLKKDPADSSDSSEEEEQQQRAEEQDYHTQATQHQVGGQSA